jgi:hypothetical protein
MGGLDEDVGEVEREKVSRAWLTRGMGERER